MGRNNRISDLLCDRAVKIPHAMQEVQETHVQSLGWEDPLEKQMAAHSSILAWKIPWTEESVQLTVHGDEESEMTEHTHTVGDQFQD